MTMLPDNKIHDPFVAGYEAGTSTRWIWFAIGFVNGFACAAALVILSGG